MYGGNLVSFKKSAKLSGEILEEPLPIRRIWRWKPLKYSGMCSDPRQFRFSVSDGLVVDTKNATSICVFYGPDFIRRSLTNAKYGLGIVASISQQTFAEKRNDVVIATDLSPNAKTVCEHFMKRALANGTCKGVKISWGRDNSMEVLSGSHRTGGTIAHRNCFTPAIRNFQF
jgi:hypothetical protein